MPREIAIVGGGMAGLETAVALASKNSRSSLHVTVFERGTSRYPGDKKSKRRSTDGWGQGGGLAEELGGRSLRYQGVFLEIEEGALRAWPQEWQKRLTGIQT